MEKVNNTFIKEKISNPKRRVEFEVGDIKQPDFIPQFKTKHWDNEANFSVRLKEDDYNGQVKEKKGKIEWSKGIKTARFYEVDVDDGGFEFEVEFSEKPNSNILEYTIQSKEFDFFYQPELTPEEIAEGRERPENVVGSYAVYHKTKKDNVVGEKEYRTGKAFHIYRPYAIDTNGEKVWCELNINEETLTITIPQDFLENAAYPIIIDPTFGYTSNGGSISYVSSGNDTSAPGMKSGGALAGTLTAISAYMRVNSGTGGDYSWCFADTQPNATWNKYQNYSPVSLSTTPAWVSKSSLSIAFSGASNAYVGIQLFYSGGGSSNPGVFYDTSAGTNGIYVSEIGNYSDAATTNYSVYATYTASGSLIKTFLGNTYANTKTVDGLAKASVKTWEGLA